MKRVLFPIVSILVLLLSPVIPFSPALAAPTTAIDAETVVRNWLALGPSHLGWKAPSAEAGEPISGAETYVDESENALFHVVYIDPKGLVIVPADDFVEPIIAFLPNAVAFDPSDDNPLGAMVGSDIPGRLNAVRESRRSASVSESAAAAESKWNYLLGVGKAPASRGVDVINDERVAPLVQSQWNQGAVYGDYCYNYYTPNHYPSGCVATVMAQLLRFHEHPTTGVGAGTYVIRVDSVTQSESLRGGDGAGGAYNWTDMPPVPDGSITEAQRQAIGALNHDAGVSVGMSYTSGGSSASLYNAQLRLLDLFGYTNAIRGYHYDGGFLTIPSDALNDMVNPNLDAGLPVALGVKRNSGGHAILCDGYGYDSSTLYHHLNMGWGGYYDAWYNLPTIDSAYTYDVVSECVYNVYTSGAGEIISGRVTDANGAPLPGAAISATPGGHTDTTDDAGIYALAKIASNTTFTITASKAGYMFSPIEQATGTSDSTGYATPVGNAWGVDFVASEESFWTGDVSTVWNLAGNWRDADIPDGDAGVCVSDAANQPTINSSAQCGSLSIESGGTLTIENDALTIM